MVGFGINGIFYKFFYYWSGLLDNFFGGNLVGNGIG